MAQGGEAVGRSPDGKTVFASFGAPGDLAEVELLQRSSRFDRGVVRSVLEPGPGRVAPPCPYYRPERPEASCGGCQIQHLSADAQLEAKAALVHDALTRIGRVEPEAATAALPTAFAPWNYRNKADFVIGASPQGPEVGYFARNSHTLIDLDECPLQAEENNAVLGAVRKILALNPTWAFDAATGRGALRRIVARTTSEGETLVTLVTQGAFPGGRQFARLLQQAVPQVTGVLQRGSKGAVQVVWGRGEAFETVGPYRFRTSGDAFFQVNRFATPALVETVLRLARAEPGQRALDLYCGVGLFSVFLAGAGAEVTGIEAHAGAILDARHNSESNGLKVEFREGHVGTCLHELEADRVDLVVLDPPRTGAAEAVAGICQKRPRTVIYVSCDPGTLARDVAAFQGCNYRCDAVVALDLFPQTAHVETVVRLVRVSP